MPRSKKKPEDQRTVRWELKLSPKEARRASERHAIDAPERPVARWTREVLMTEADSPRALQVERLEAKIRALELDLAHVTRERDAARWQVQSLMCSRNGSPPTPSRSDLEGDADR